MAILSDQIKQLYQIRHTEKRYFNEQYEVYKDYIIR